MSTLIKACWEGDPAKRPDSDAIVAYLKSEQQDFQAFLPGFLASRQSRSFGQAVEGNLASSGANASSFNRALAGNLATTGK